MKTKKLNSVFALGVVISLIGVYACSTSNTTTTKPATKTNVTDDSELPDRGITFKSSFKGKLNKIITDDEIGVKVSNYSFTAGSDDNNNGGKNERGSGTIDITGLGSHKINIEMENYPVMDNKEDVQTITDETTGNSRIFTSDQDLQKYSISDGKTKMIIETNPDGTWTVDGQPAKTEKDVAKLAMQSPIFSDVSPHSIALIYELFENQGKVSNDIVFEKTLAPVCCVNCHGPDVKGEPGNPKFLLKEGLKLLKEKNSK
jgi:hypothetical protein